MNSLEIILILTVIFVSHVIQGITGFAGTLIAMPWIAMLIGIEEARGILNLITILSCITIAVTSFRNICWRELLKISVLMSVGLCFGLQLIKVLDSQMLLSIYGIFIICVAIRGLVIMKMGQEKSNEKSSWYLYLVLVLAGVIHGMYVSGGALVIIYATTKFKDKEVFRVTVAMIWIILNSIIAVGDFYRGVYEGVVINYVIICAIPCLLATYLGVKLQKYLSIKMFLVLSYILLIISGLTIVV